MDLNKVMIIGNVVRDPETRTTPSGANVTSFAIATNRVWKDKAGQQQKKAEFHNVVAWRKLGEIISQYVKKGSKIYLEGRLETRSWDDQNGIKRYRTEVIADNMIMLDRAQSGASYSNANEPTYSDPEPIQAPVIDQPVEEEVNIDDIPF